MSRAESTDDVQRDALAAFEARVADALCARDPGAAFEALLREGSPTLAIRLDPAQSDGFRVAALLVARLRFERLMHGSRRAGEWFATDARAFTEEFRRYHIASPPLATTPMEEAAQFERWSSTSRG